MLTFIQNGTVWPKAYINSMQNFRKLLSLPQWILKALRNYKQKLFLCPTFQNNRRCFTLCYIKPNIYIQKTKFVSHKQYLFCVLTCRNEKKKKKKEEKTDQSIPCVFLFCLKRNHSQNFKSGSCKILFTSVYVVVTTCFVFCFM